MNEAVKCSPTPSSMSFVLSNSDLNQSYLRLSAPALEAANTHEAS